MNVTFSLFTGKVRGDETMGNKNINFSSSIFSQTIGVEYNFRPLLKTNMEGRQLIRPFIGVAFGAMQFRAKADLKDAQGRAYYYWSDGKIYNQAEGQSDPDLLVELQRDNEYETDLRDRNNDGLGKYPQLAFTMPINAGVRFQIGRNVGANVHLGYMLNFTDMVDDLSEAGSGMRARSAGNDNSLFASVGLTVFMGRTKPLPRPTPTPAPIVKVEVKDTVSAAKVEPAESKIETTSGSGIATSQTEFAAAPAAVPVSFEEALRQQEERNRRLLDAKLNAKPNQTTPVIASPEGRSAADGELAKVESSVSQSDAVAAGSNADKNSSGKADTAQKTENQTIDGLSATVQAANPSSSKNSEQLVEQAQSVAEGAATEESHQTIISTNAEGSNPASNPSVQGSNAALQATTGVIVTPSVENSGLNADAGQDAKDRKPAQPTVHTGDSGNPGQATSGTEAATQNDASGSIQTENRGQATIQNAAVVSVEGGQDAGKSTFPSEREALRIEAEKVGAKDVNIFHWADRDKSGKITPDEVLFYIDQLFEGSGELGVAEIQDLIDYYFEQP